MAGIRHAALAVALAANAVLAADEPWRRRYEGAEASGPEVLALWQFLPGAEAADSSGRGHDLTLRGESRFVADGLFGSCLESFHVDADRPQGATARSRPGLTPKGAFTIELWVRPKPEFAAAKQAFLLDKQYYRREGDPRANKDYELSIRPVEGGRHVVDAYLGFGEDAALFRSAPVSLRVGEWRHVVFAYDGAGLGRFFVDGKAAGSVRREGRGAVAPGPHPLVIGGRVGSLHVGFPGFVDQVRILNGAPGWLPPPPAPRTVPPGPPPAAAAAGAPEGPRTATVTLTGSRTVFLRFEPDAALTVTIANTLGIPFEGVQVTATVDGSALPAPPRIAGIADGSRARVKVPLDASLKPGVYGIGIQASGRAGGEVFQAQTAGELAIVPRPLPHVLPVVMWGIPELSYKETDFASLKEMGFTHTLLRQTDVANYPRIWAAGKALVPSLTPDQTLAQMDAMLAAGLRCVANLSPGSWVVAGGDPEAEARKATFQRINRQGEPYGRTNVCALAPEVQRFAYNVGVSIGQGFGRHPALAGALIHTEVRDGSNLCFHPHDRDAYRAHAGRDVPEEARERNGVPSRRRAEIVPRSGVVPDDHPLLQFYRWFWREGDGWNGLHTQVHRGLESGTHPGFWTFFDPAVRCPPIWGSGGEADVLSHWTYTYPDPPRIGLATDELLAMAAGRPGQRVMKMTQIIWYRNQTAPDLPAKEADRAPWERTEPEARFITIAPDHLREAFWLKLSRPVQGIMYHGSQSLGMGDRGHTGAYRYTNPETRAVLAEVVHQVAVPLGPTLMQIPDPAADVAMLESFASSTFGTAGTWGWGNGWAANVHLVLQWARLQPRIVYEETILRDGLDGVRVLVAPNCPVLPAMVHERIVAFQRRGGILVGDRHLAPGLVPDVLLAEPPTGTAPDGSKAALQALAAQLRQELAPLYAWEADSSDADILVRRRRHGEADYLFAINDKRRFGTYVGHHRRVMEDGVPHTGTLSIARPGATVYDLRAGREVVTRAAAVGLAWEASLGPGEGQLYMIVPRPLAEVDLTVAARRPEDRVAQVRLQVRDAAGRPLSAVVPVQVDVRDPTGETAEFSGHYGAAGGELALRLDLAPNDAPGTWTVRARELASGKSAETRFDFQP